MQKIANEKVIKKLIMLYLIIQPILEISWLSNIEWIKITLPTWIRLSLFGILVILFIIDKRKWKFFIAYGSILALYATFHLIHANQFQVPLRYSYSVIGEIVYLIRLSIPICFIYLLLQYPLQKKQIKNIIKWIVGIFSITIIITNMLMIANLSYPTGVEMCTNIFGWPFVDGLNVSECMATKGIFEYANELAGVLVLLLPIMAYITYKKMTVTNVLLLIGLCISMLILGTRVSSYGVIIIMIIMTIAYYIMEIIRKKKKENKIEGIAKIIILFVIFGIYSVSPAMKREEPQLLPSSEVTIKENKLVEKARELQELKNHRQEKIEFILENSKYFYVNPIYVEEIYLAKQDPEFWIDCFNLPLIERNNNRKIENILINHIYQKNNNKNDKWWGMGYTNTFKNDILIEHDYFAQYYMLGIFGIIVFVIPYFLYLAYAAYQIIKKKQFHYFNFTLTLGIGILLGAALMSGNILDSYIANTYLAFTIATLISNRKNESSTNILKQNKSDIKVSVIVPIYNVEKYLKDCIESLLNQTLKEIEIILVNDGSKDNCQTIIEKYQKQYPDKITTLIQENQGQGKARQNGLSIAQGEYISFIDSDDKIDSTMLEKMYQKAKEQDFDVVVCYLNLITPTKTTIIKPGYTKDILNEKELKKSMITHYPSVCNRIYKKEILKNTQFQSKIYFEDVDFLYRLYPNIKTIGLVKEPLYLYYERQNSTTTTYDERLFDYLKVWDSILSTYKKNNWLKTYQKEIECSYARYLYATFLKRAACLKEELYQKAKIEAEKRVKENFPHYKKNHYIYTSLNGFTALYLLLYSDWTSKLLYKIQSRKR